MPKLKNYNDKEVAEIKSFTIKQFKSYEEATLPISSLTVLVGANASGKSNALEAIRFLSWLAQGKKLSALPYETNVIIRGNLQDLTFNKSENHFFSIGCTKKNGEELLALDITFDIRPTKEIHIKDEKCYNESVLLYETVRPTEGKNTDISVAYNNFAKGGKKPQITCFDQQAIFGQLISPANFSSKKSKEIIPAICNSLEKSLANIIFLDPVPNTMRRYSYPDDKLRENGENISGVLYELWNNSDVKNKENILSFIKSLPEQDIADISFIKTPRDEVMIQLVETFGNNRKKIDAELLSDGTLRVLAIAAILLSAPKGCLVIIEEIDNGIHPNRAEKLLKSIRKVAQERGLSVLISSHNPALLDALPDEVLPDVVFCYRDKNNGTSQLLKLGDFEEYVELISQGTLGTLVTKGTLDRLVKNHTSAEEKQSKALEWLNSLSEK